MNDPFDLAQRPLPLTVSKIAWAVCLGNLLSVVIATLLFGLLGVILGILGVAMPHFLK